MSVDRAGSCTFIAADHFVHEKRTMLEPDASFYTRASMNACLGHTLKSLRSSASPPKAPEQPFTATNCRNSENHETQFMISVKNLLQGHSVSNA